MIKMVVKRNLDVLHRDKMVRVHDDSGIDNEYLQRKIDLNTSHKEAQFPKSKPLSALKRCYKYCKSRLRMQKVL